MRQEPTITERDSEVGILDEPWMPEPNRGDVVSVWLAQSRHTDEPHVRVISGPG